MLDAGRLEAVKLEIAQFLLPGQHLMQMTGSSTSLKSLLGLSPLHDLSPLSVSSIVLTAV